jgi:amidase
MSSTALEVGALDALDQAELVRCGQVSALELVRWAIERIEELNPTLNAVVTPTYDRALAEAATTMAGPLAGVPYLLKDLATETAGVRFTQGSRFLRGYISSYDSELVRRLRQAGLVIVGKTNTPEFGLVPTCEPVLFGPTRNPWDVRRSTSGPVVAQPPPWRPAWCRPCMQTTSVARSASRRRPVDSLVSSRRAPGTRSDQNTATW